jgi:hypothetical protein
VPALNSWHASSSFAVGVQVRTAWLAPGKTPYPKTPEKLSHAPPGSLILPVKTAEPVKMPDMARAMAQSIIDMVMEQNERLQAPLFAERWHV